LRKLIYALLLGVSVHYSDNYFRILLIQTTCFHLHTFRTGSHVVEDTSKLFFM